MRVIDPRSFPTTARYLERLPAGLRSHPQCLVKASVLRDVLDARPLSLEDMSALPEEVHDLAKAPPPVSAWVSEVHSIVLMLAIRDRHFAAGEAGHEAYEQWTYERNRRLLARPLYRAVFLLLSPERLLRGAERRWGVFRRGSTLELVSREEGVARMRTVYPSFLAEETVAHGLRGALRAATELAGGRDASVDLVSVGERETLFDVRWRS